VTSLPTALSGFLVHVFLTALPIVTGILVAFAFGVRDRLIILSLGLCSLLGTGDLTFWIFWASPTLGRVFTLLLTPALVVVVGSLGYRARAHLNDLGTVVLRPFLVWVAGSILIFSLGSMYPSSRVATTTAESRFLSALPIDNAIPQILANALQAPRRPLPRPLYVIWDSSDRPPLQAGVYLSQEGVLPGTDSNAVDYQIVGVLLQGLWIFGIWGLLGAVRAAARLRALTLTALLFSGFVVVNTFYTWPKLFPATYLLLLTAILLTPRFQDLRGSVTAGATTGALAGAALLGHEGSGLALLAFVVVMAIQRRRPSKNFVLGAMAVLVVTQGSWMAYQRFVDPPGDQLARLQIANQLKLPGDPRPLLTVTIAAYQKTPVDTILNNKLSNLETPFSNVPEYVSTSARLVQTYLKGGKGSAATRLAAVHELRVLNFFNLVPSVGFLSLGFFAWIVAAYGRRRLTPVLRLAGTIWIFLAVNVVTWAFILFGPQGTIIHQGTYVTELLAFTGCVIGLWSLSRRLCAALVVLQSTMTVIVYGFNGAPDNVVHRLDTQMLVLSLVALAFMVGALFFSAREPSEVGNDHSLMTDGRAFGRTESGVLVLDHE